MHSATPPVFAVKVRLLGLPWVEAGAAATPDEAGYAAADYLTHLRSDAYRGFDPEYEFRLHAYLPQGETPVTGHEAATFWLALEEAGVSVTPVDDEE